MDERSSKYPQFEDLPLREGDPPYSSWGLWGLDDEVGTIVCIQAVPHSSVILRRLLHACGKGRIANMVAIEPPYTRGIKKGRQGDNTRAAI